MKSESERGRSPIFRVAHSDATPTLPEIDKIKIPETLTVVVILAPGFLAQAVYSYWLPADQQSATTDVASAFAWTLLVFVIAWFATKRRHSAWGWADMSVAHVATQPRFIAALVVAAIVAGSAWAYIDGNGYLFRLGLTSRVSRQTPWHVVFSEHARQGQKRSAQGAPANGKSALPSQPYVRITTKSGTIYHGLVDKFSEGADSRMLYLRSARRQLVVGNTLSPCESVSADIVDSYVLLSGDQIVAIEERQSAGGVYECTGREPAAGAPLRPLLDTGSDLPAIKPVEFVTGRWDLSKEAVEVVRTARDYLRSHPETGALVFAYTDTQGNLTINRSLATKRADAVAGALVSEGGISGSRIFVTALPETDLPLFTGRKEDSQPNRVVQVVLIPMPSRK